MTINEAAIDRKNNLNIIRLIASLMVLYMHSFAVSVGSQTEDIFYTLTNHKDLAGGIAVYIFFIISGFLICRSFDRSKSVVKYAKARFLRIWPLLFVVVMALAFILGPIISEYTFYQYFHYGDLRGFLLNWVFISSDTNLPGVFPYHYIHSINGSLWTLMYEVIWYIIVAITAFLWKKRKAVVVAMYAFLTALYLCINAGLFTNVPVLSTGYALNMSKLGMFFTMGMAYYLYSDKIKLSIKAFIVAFIGLILGILFCNFIFTFSIFGPYIIFYIAFQKRFIATWYDKIGDLSYGIYIMSFPIQQTLVECLGEPTYGYNTLSMNPYFNMLLTLIIVLPLSFLTWHFIEQPCLKLKNK